jgi:hypothetical protein
MNDPVICCLNQAEEQGDRKEQPKAVQPLPDLWLYPSTQAKQIAHCDLKAASVGGPFNNKTRCADADLGDDDVRLSDLEPKFVC